MGNTIGMYAFYIGLIIAILAGIAAAFGSVNLLTNNWVLLVLAIIGIIVGLANITDKEIQTFLIATIALMLSSSALGAISIYIPGLNTFTAALLAFISPAAFIVSIKAIYDLAKD